MEKQQLLVIGVGLPRTGTLSTALALAKLLQCDATQIHHGMYLNTFSQDQLDFWIKALDGGEVTHQDWRDYFRHYKACLDLPAILFFKDLMEAFPKAKVILTVRDTDSWFKSWHNSIAKSLRLIENPFYKHFLKLDEKVGARHQFAALV